MGTAGSESVCGDVYGTGGAFPRSLPLVALLLAACGAGEPAASGTTVRDSAGITIVENAAPAWGDGAGWRLSEAPVLSIGEVEGDSVYLLSFVSDAVRLPDGGVVVADGGSVSLRFYDAAGRYLRSAGRRGEGPGEFEFLRGLWLRDPDTLVAMDGRSDRISFFDLEGRFLRSMRLEMAEGRHNANAMGQFADGRFFALSGSRGFVAADAGKLIRDSLRFYSFEPDGGFATTLAVIPSAERWGLGVVEIPRRFRIRQIGADFVLGISRDELGVQRVEVYGLAKLGVAPAGFAQ